MVPVAITILGEALGLKQWIPAADGSYHFYVDEEKVTLKQIGARWHISTSVMHEAKGIAPEQLIKFLSLAATQLLSIKESLSISEDQTTLGLDRLVRIEPRQEFLLIDAVEEFLNTFEFLQSAEKEKSNLSKDSFPLEKSSRPRIAAELNMELNRAKY